MDGDNRNEALMRYLSGELTFEEWNDLCRIDSQDSTTGLTVQAESEIPETGDAESLTGRLTGLTVVSTIDGATILSTTSSSGASMPAGTKIFSSELQGGQVLVDAAGNAVLVQDSVVDTTSQVADDAEIEIIADVSNAQLDLPIPISEVKTEAPDLPDDVSPEGDVTDEDSDDVVIIDPETTMRYLTGEMPFEEYSALLEQRIKEEPEETVVDTVGLELEVTAGGELTVVQPSSGAAPSQPEDQKKAKKKIKKPHAHLPKDLQGLMGEANMKFARGEHDEAIKMCMEVIRLAPTAPEPFQTLGMLYEERGDNEKALQFLLIAAHLNPSDSEEWVRLAEMSLDANNIRQAISCYDKAIKYDSSNMNLLWARCDLHEQTSDVTKALSGYQQILKLLPSDDAPKYFQLARDMTKSYHSLSLLDKATTTMEEAFKQHPSHVSAEDVNLLLELYMSTSEYHKPVQVLVDHCGVGLASGSDDLNTDPALLSATVQLGEVMLPEEFPIDLKVKLIVCLIHLEQRQCLQPLVAPLLLENPDEVGDLYLDIAEAYMDRGDYSDARQFLVPLVHSENYNLAAVWLRYGECLNSLSELQLAAEAYGKVVELAPTHMEARVSLSALKQQLGRHEEALEVLNHGVATEGETPPVTDLRLMLPRCLLLYTQARYDEFIECSKVMLFGSFRDIFTKSHLAVILSNRSLKHRIAALRNVIGPSFDQKIREASGLLQEPSVTVEDLWELYLKLCQSLIDMGRLDEFQKVSITALMSPHFMNDPTRAQEADFICLTSCLINKTCHFAYNFIREICVKQLDNNRAWNLFCQIITMSQDIRHNRFCLRLMIKHPDHLALGVLNAHNAMVAGTYKHALGEYVCAFQKDPHNPLLSLCIGITFIHMACQKFASCRHSLTIQGCAFLNQYLELRGECQEAYYNVGRAMHQLGLLHAAVFYYRKALGLGCAVQEAKGTFDLSREAAFNLTLIYQASNSQQMASHITQRYLVI